MCYPGGKQLSIYSGKKPSFADSELETLITPANADQQDCSALRL